MQTFIFTENHRHLPIASVNDSLLNWLRKLDKTLGKPRIFLFSQTRSINSIKHEHSCKILYLYDCELRYSPKNENTNFLILKQIKS